MQKKSKNKENYQKITKRHYIKAGSLSKKTSRNLKNKNSGITLLALCITIIVIIILASITIGTISRDNGIIKNAGKAKDNTEISNEKEIISVAVVKAMEKNKRGVLKEEEFQEELNNQAGREGIIQATDIGERFEVIFTESNRYYEVDKDGNIGEVQEFIKDKNPGDITVGQNGEKLDGSQEHPYEIWCIEDLISFSNMVNGSGIKLEDGKPTEITSGNSFNGKYIELKTSLNFKSKISYNDSERTDFGNINGEENDGNTLINEMTTGTGFRAIGNEKCCFERDL